jgi:hypothetical protein
VIEKLRHMVSDGSFVGTELTGGVLGGEKTYEVKFGDDFYYEDPIDGSIAKQQVYIFLILYFYWIFRLLNLGVSFWP